MRFTLSLLAILLGVCRPAWSGDGCDLCGCCGPLTKYCRAVCAEKEVKSDEWSCKTEDFCVPGPSNRCVTRDECGQRHECWQPACATVRTRRVLVKKEVSKKVPTVNWIVEALCPECCP